MCVCLINCILDRVIICKLETIQQSLPTIMLANFSFTLFLVQVFSFYSVWLRCSKGGRVRVEIKSSWKVGARRQTGFLSHKQNKRNHTGARVDRAMLKRVP